MREQYINQEILRVLGRYNSAKHHPGFANAHDLSTWYGNQLRQQDCKCYYCETSILDIKRLINAELLATRAVGGGGRRGPVLEIDKKVNQLGYNQENCVLACYYCNNDKSYIFGTDDYKRFYGPARHEHFRHLIAQLIVN